MPVVGIPTLTPEEEAAWVRMMKANIPVFPSQTSKAKRRTRATVEQVESRRASTDRENLVAMYRRELHASLPEEVKKYLNQR